MHVTKITIHPYKSSPPIGVEHALTAEHGFAGDRRFMIVDAHGVFITQRDSTAIGRTTVILTPTGFDVSAPELGTLHVARPMDEVLMKVREWGGEFDAFRCDRHVDEWFPRSSANPSTSCTCRKRANVRRLEGTTFG